MILGLWSDGHRLSDGVRTGGVGLGALFPAQSDVSLICRQRLRTFPSTFVLVSSMGMAARPS